jgi:hypothetical protein
MEYQGDGPWRCEAPFSCFLRAKSFRPIARSLGETPSRDGIERVYRELRGRLSEGRMFLS